MTPINDLNVCYPESHSPVDPEPIPWTPDTSVDSEAQMCWASDSYASTPQAQSPDDFLRSRVALRQGVLTRQQIDLQANAAAFDGVSTSPSGSNSTVLGALAAIGGFGLFGCNHAPVEDSPPDTVDDPPDENPDPTPTDADGIGEPNMSYASSVCGHPVDMDVDAARSRIFTTCADDPNLDPSSPGVGVVEILDVSGTSPSTNSIELPTTDPDSGRPIVLTTSHFIHLEDNDLLYVGFRAAGSTSQLESGDAAALAEDSGIFIVDPDDPASVTTVRFSNLLASGPGVQVSNFRNPDSDPTFLPGFTPNTPLAIAQSGNELYVLTANTVFNDLASNPLDVVKPTVLAYTIGADGSLTEREVTSQLNRLVRQDTLGYSNAYQVSSGFFPGGMAKLTDGRLVVLTRGVPPEDPSSADSPSALAVIPSGLSDGADVIPITASASEPSFLAFSPGHLDCRTIGGVPYAQVGSVEGGASGENSGRVAHINLDSGELEYLTPYKMEGENIANVIFHPDSSVPASFVLSEAGGIRTLFSDTNEIAPDHSIASAVTGTTDTTDLGNRRRVPAVVLGAYVYVAAGGSYSSAEILTPTRQ